MCVSLFTPRDTADDAAHVSSQVAGILQRLGIKTAADLQGA